MVYGFVGMKIHAKLCLVVRREAEGVVSYAHIGTGNYNASTARLYTDMGILTCQPDICADMADLFNVMTGYAEKDNYRELLVLAQFHAPPSHRADSERNRRVRPRRRRRDHHEVQSARGQKDHPRACTWRPWRA